MCGCGERFITQAITPSIRVEVCSKCHPFYTGKQKLLDAAGRVEKFQRRYGWTQGAADAAAGKAKPDEQPEAAPEATPAQEAAPEAAPAQEAEPEAAAADAS